MVTRVIFIRTFFLLLASSFSLLASAPALADDAQPALTDAEKKFTERMTNVVMNGQATTGNGAPKADKYTILSVKKVKGDDWTFTAAMKLGDKEFNLPMTVQVKWAGDTPVICVTDFGFPGLGASFTARVVVYGDSYAGTWQANAPNPHGGHLWGKIEKAPAK